MQKPDDKLRLDAETLTKLAHLHLRVRRVVEGTMAGLHRSPHRGSSIEFAEHKEYSPGDDLRRLDWKAFARFDRYYIREHEDETELKAYLLVDCSGSMGYGAPISKLDCARVLAGSLAYLFAGQRDQPSLLAFADEVRCYVPPRSRRGHVAAVLEALAALEPRGKTDFERAVLRLTDVMGRRSLVIVVSDLFDTGGAAIPLLRQLRARGHHVVLLQLLHHDEVEFPFDQVLRFEGMEDDRSIFVDPAGTRQVYLKQLEAFCADVARGCREAQVVYRRVTTDEPLDRVLAELWQQRIW